MEKRALQLFIVVLLLLSLQLFDYSLNKPQLLSSIPVTGAAVSDSQTATCAETSPCKSPASWKCKSNSRCYDYSDCLFQCPSAPSSQQPQTCTCGDWQTIGGCGEQGCPSDKVPQSKSCTGGSSCKNENRCLESTQCKADQLPGQKCVNYLCIEDQPGIQYCSSKCTIDGNRYESSECEQKCAAATAQLPQGVNLFPELAVTPQEGLKGGDTMQVVLRVKNTGTKGTKDSSVFGKCTGAASQICGLSFYSIVYFYKDNEYGSRVLPELSATADLVSNEIKPLGAGSLEVIKQSVKLPDDFSGKLVVVAVIDSQQTYPEAEGGKADNKQSATLTAGASAPPNLVPTEAEPSPSLDALSTTGSVTVYSVRVRVKNDGGRIAKADQFLENKVSILKESSEICRGESRDLGEIRAGIKPGESKDFNPSVKALNGEPCKIDDKNANYWAVVDVDTMQQGNAKGVITESSETDNGQTFQLKGPQQCSPPGTRQAAPADKYCSITGAWLTQKDVNTACTHSFECRTDLCLGKESNSKKCISEEKKAKILEIVG
ncbi:hypothetical protein HYU16_02370 [Candidatus Woesearchaeota archaeon]|nr:hypothetical protein [Candidatus Woesearchaeota archaeon]